MTTRDGRDWKIYVVRFGGGCASISYAGWGSGLRSVVVRPANMLLSGEPENSESRKKVFIIKYKIMGLRRPT